LSNEKEFGKRQNILSQELKQFLEYYNKKFLCQQVLGVTKVKERIPIKRSLSSANLTHI